MLLQNVGQAPVGHDALKIWSAEHCIVEAHTVDSGILTPMSAWLIVWPTRQDAHMATQAIERPSLVGLET
jgi:hypothetical protein